MGRKDQPDPFGARIGPLLIAAKSSLTCRNFDECRAYASKAKEANPNHPGPTQLLAVASILSVTPPLSANQTEPPPDWYSILGLPRFCQDLKAIRAQFDLLYTLVNPDKNPYPFASEARQWVLKAGAVLADVDLKAQFDKDLRARKGDAGNGAGGTFWTVCPYCYFMYEYENAFLDCALRCSNPNCRRPFAAAAVAASAVPSPEVVERGKYDCGGFIPLRTNDAGNGGDKSWKWWEALVSMGSGSGTGMGDEGQKSKAENSSGVVDLTDDGKKAGEEIKKKGNVNAVVRRRRKQAATGKKKVMGKGIRANWNASFSAGEEGVCEGMKLNEVNTNREGSGLEFAAGDDDILVSLNGDPGIEGLGA